MQSLDGRYYTACDVGTYSEDMDVIARECSFVTGRTVAHGGAGDSSVLTAYGVFQGMRASAEASGARRPLAGRTVGVAGVGKVGRHLVEHLVEDGAERGRHRRAPAGAWTGCASEYPRSTAVARHRRAGRPTLDVYAPCALGGALTDEVVDVLSRQDRLRRRQQPARPPRHREGAARSAASSTRPTTA